MTTLFSFIHILNGTLDFVVLCEHFLHSKGNRRLDVWIPNQWVLDDLDHHYFRVKEWPKMLNFAHYPSPPPFSFFSPFVDPLHVEVALVVSNNAMHMSKSHKTQKLYLYMYTSKNKIY